LISRGIGDFSVYPARACLFSDKPGETFQSTRFLVIRSACFDQSSGETGRGGRKKNKKIGVFSFRGILQPTTARVRVVTQG